MKRAAAGLALTIIFLTACNQAELPTSSSDNAGRWELQTFEMGGNTVTISNPERYTVAFTDEGPLRLRNEQFQRDDRPLQAGCPCAACRRSRGYLRHLFQAKEMYLEMYK